ncbi:hypothetical protein C3747_112g132 [Trypanosoma cruzi]|uniref:Uncharacterized protein n=2 Tax=Trypanosoma cruzi TaxID=5693 RepID=Q4DAY1_TRYCC|nr:uncharacterized protein Tc00.1047053506579.60 [Trypanosoma cruzi]EAN89681.1 hypothetical protein, conserved [Trypanosoma cruzi]PWV06624.1 hypothetical protein C3747_112g132 [Trypanosoma cruzi]RNC58984.1 hypothetical protein TcCL_ESM03366 [Trypanosoma cruzi]|eukprot:XP_811532.1 hypothetical protein Tc00.1047053506579.60 [Trypanosoma cruzi strain CL Brener]
MVQCVPHCGGSAVSSTPAGSVSSPVDAGDATRDYIALAVPLLHVLQQRQTTQALAVAREITRRWGEKEGPVADLLRFLQNYEDLQQQEEEVEGEESDDDDDDDDGSSSSTASSDAVISSCSTDDDDDAGSVENSAAEGGDVTQTLRQILARLPPCDAAGTSISAGLNATPVVNETAEESETEEERRIFNDIAGAVEREMKRLAIIRKHR